LIQYQSQNDGSGMSEWLVCSRSRMPLSEGPFFYELFLQNAVSEFWKILRSERGKSPERINYHWRKEG
jgi:hypothetical protein